MREKGKEKKKQRYEGKKTSQKERKSRPAKRPHTVHAERCKKNKDRPGH
jgi:hypothetical protein